MSETWVTCDPEVKTAMNSGALNLRQLSVQFSILVFNAVQHSEGQVATSITTRYCLV